MKNRSRTASGPEWLCWDFFKLFSRMEFALKISGFLLKKEHADAKANWTEFSTALGPEYFCTLVNSNKVQTLLDHPPMKQVVEHGKLSWLPLERPKNTRTLLEAVRRVRNNLFHGGKVPFDFHRDAALIAESMFALEAALEMGPEAVRVAFHAAT